MRRTIWSAVALTVLACGPAFAHGDHGDGRRMEFPAAANGQLILPVDLHTHSVFSDGSVWPDIRVEEAKRDGLAALAVTEHLEYQPHAADIPHPNRNRSFQVATEQASGSGLLIINGAEITRDMPPGHVNSVFLTDVNGLRRRDAADAIRSANEQGGFLFWNHPFWTRQAPDGVTRLTPMHEQLIAAGQLHGIEVANGSNYSESALALALEKNLVILGTSDIHGLIDWDYDLKHGDHRTVTLALAGERTADSIREALRAGRTVAWYRDLLIGKPENVEAVVRASLRLVAGEPVEGSRVIATTLHNASSVHYRLRALAPTAFYNQGDMISVAPNGEITLEFTGGIDPAATEVTFEVLNAVTAPDRTLTLTLPLQAP
jgi:hypothetical protein